VNQASISPTGMAEVVVVVGLAVGGLASVVAGVVSDMMGFVHLFACGG